MSNEGERGHSRWIVRPFDGYAAKNLPSQPDEELTRVGPASPCGEYLRRFWQPVAMSAGLGPRPCALRILGEDLVLFRDGSGRLGLVHRHCAHRRMSLEYGRIEERGIRCAYHGWLYDIDGRILETPGEPNDSTICNKICLGAYPVHEFKGLVFAYLGPPAAKPPFPHFDSFDLEGDELVPYSIHSPCNWLQEHENAIDPMHVVFLHGRVSGPQFPGLEHFAQLPVLSFHETPIGYMYTHARRVGELVKIRIHDHIAPNLAQNGSMFKSLDRPVYYNNPSLTKWVVPIDDTNTRKFGWRHFDAGEPAERGAREVGWERVDFYGQTGHRNYEEMQANPGDWEAWVSQGPITVHQREYLGTSDRGVTMFRSRLRRQIRAVARNEDPVLPQGTPAKPVHTYAGDVVLRIPQRMNDERDAILGWSNQVWDIHQRADRYEGDDRKDFVTKALKKLER